MKIQFHNIDKHMTMTKSEHQINIVAIKFEYVILN